MNEGYGSMGSAAEPDESKLVVASGPGMLTFPSPAPLQGGALVLRMF